MASRKSLLGAVTFHIRFATAAVAVVIMIPAAPDITAAQAVLMAATVVRGHQAVQTMVLAAVIMAVLVVLVHLRNPRLQERPLRATGLAAVAAECGKMQLRSRATATKAYVSSAYLHKEVKHGHLCNSTR